MKMLEVMATVASLTMNLVLLITMMKMMVMIGSVIKNVLIKFKIQNGFSRLVFTH